MGVAMGRMGCGSRNRPQQASLQCITWAMGNHPVKLIGNSKHGQVPLTCTVTSCRSGSCYSERYCRSLLPSLTLPHTGSSLFSFSIFFLIFSKFCSCLHFWYIFFLCFSLFSLFFFFAIGKPKSINFYMTKDQQLYLLEPPFSPLKFLTIILLIFIFTERGMPLITLPRGH